MKYNWQIKPSHRQRATESLKKTLRERVKKAPTHTVYCQRCGVASNEPFKQSLTVNINIQINVCKECYEKNIIS